LLLLLAATLPLREPLRERTRGFLSDVSLREVPYGKLSKRALSLRDLSSRELEELSRRESSTINP
jgi:hypothetical protein